MPPPQQPSGVGALVVFVGSREGIGVQHLHAQLRGKAAQFLLPVFQQRGRRYDESRPGIQHPTLVQVCQPSNDLEGLAQPHIICQASAKTCFGDSQQEAHPLPLVGAQGGIQRRGKLQSGGCERK